MDVVMSVWDLKLKPREQTGAGVCRLGSVEALGLLE